MMGRLTPLAALVLALSGCTALTPTDLKFLDHDAGGDTGVPDCATGQAIELPAQCHDGCDNDGDNAEDCADDDCDLYCCEITGSEILACNDGCDNDFDLLIDCEDPECEETSWCETVTPPESDCDEGDPDVCCSNGEDDDDDGDTDCADPDCTRSERCCETVDSFRDGTGGGFDTSYWVPFGGRDVPEFDDVDGQSWLVDWRSGTEIGGVASSSPLDLAFGLSVELTTQVVTTEPCIDPEACPSYTGIAFGPAPAPAGPGDPARNLSVLVTSSHHVAVVRGGLVLHRIGIEPSPGSDDSPIQRIRVDLLPAADQGGVNGFRMELRVPGGRRPCGENGSSIGCAAEEVWASEDLVLLAEDNILDAGGRGASVMVIGEGDGVRLGDFADNTVAVTVRGCNNPAAWRPGSRASYVGAEVLCWAVGALGSPTVTELAGDTFGMVLHGTTRDPVPAEYGINNYSLGWLTTSDVDAVWSDPYTMGHVMRRPIDTDLDLNCMGDLEWIGAECRDVPEHPAEPADCRGQLSHRTPHVISSSIGEHRVLFAESLAPTERIYKVRAARFTPATWVWEDVAHELTPEDLELALGERSYQSVRDPVAICKNVTEIGGCTDGRFMVLAVAEAETGGAWAGDEIIYVEYSLSTGFDTTSADIVLGPDDANPLRGRELSEPWVLWDGDTEQFFLWVTSAGSEGGETQVDLLLAECPGCVGDSPPDRPLVQSFALYEGSPVLSSEDLDVILRSAEGVPWVDCSGLCEIGGVSAVRIEGGEDHQDTLHMWVGIAEKPASGDLATWGIHHLTQPFGLPGRTDS